MAVKKIIDKNTIIEMFQKKKIRTYYDVPEEFINDIEIIALQRKLGHRISNLRGYDVIKNEFFVEESVAREKQGREYIYDETSISVSVPPKSFECFKIIFLHSRLFLVVSVVPLVNPTLTPFLLELYSRLWYNLFNK